MDARSALTKFNVLTARPIDNTNGLVGWWTFDDGTATDWSGNQNNGSLINGPTAIGGIVGNALNFNGTNQYVSIPSSSNLQGFKSGAVFSSWVNCGAISDSSGASIITLPIVAGSTITDPYELYGTLINITTRTVNFYLSKGNAGSRVTLTSSGTIPINIWTHIAARWNGSTMFIYINGKQDANTVSFSGPVSTNSVDVRIGTFNSQTVNAFFPGIIDDMRIYGIDKSPGEINAIYNRALVYQQGQPEGEMPALYLAPTTLPFLINPLIITAEQPVLHPFPMVAARSVQGPNVGTPEIRRIITSQEQTEYYSTRPITRAGVYTTGFNPVWAIKSNIIFPGPAGT